MFQQGDETLVLLLKYMYLFQVIGLPHLVDGNIAPVLHQWVFVPTRSGAVGRQGEVFCCGAGHCVRTHEGIVHRADAVSSFEDQSPPSEFF